MSLVWVGGADFLSGFAAEELRPAQVAQLGCLTKEPANVAGRVLGREVVCA